MEDWKLDVKAYAFPPLRQWQSQFSDIFSNDPHLFRPIGVKLSSLTWASLFDYNKCKGKFEGKFSCKEPNSTTKLQSS